MNTRKKIPSLLPALVAIGFLAGCGGNDTDSEKLESAGEIRSAITGGGLVSTTRAPYSSVVDLNGGCSGLKLNSNWYLTAQHCGFLTGQAVSVTNALNPATGASYVSSIIEVRDHPTNFYLPYVYRYDLTMVRLADANPIPSWSPRYLAQVDGAGGRGVGYGCDAAPGSTNGGQKQYADFATVPYPDQSYGMYWFASYGDPSLCPGDSGGPFVQINGTSYYLTGVASIQNQANNPHFSAWARVSPARQWIATVTAGLTGFNEFREGVAGTFINKSSNWCAEFDNRAILSQLWCRFADEPPQQFVVHVVDPAGIYEFHWSSDPSRCLAIQDTSAPVTVLACDGSPNQRWTVNTIAGQTDFRYRAIMNLGTGLCMQASSDTRLSTGIFKANCSNTPESYWVFTP